MPVQLQPAALAAPATPETLLFTPGPAQQPAPICSVAVHQQCYGVHKVPEGKWLCEACRAKLKPGAAHCCVCPVVGGAVKKVGRLGGAGWMAGWMAAA